MYFSEKTLPDNQRTLRACSFMWIYIIFFWFNDFGFSIHVALFLRLYKHLFFGHVYLWNYFCSIHILQPSSTSHNFVLISSTTLSNSFQKHMNKLKKKLSLLHWQNPFYLFLLLGNIVTILSFFLSSKLRVSSSFDHHAIKFTHFFVPKALISVFCS